MDIYTAIIVGHFFGDYLFQTDWMAYNKYKHTKEGWLACFVHAMSYSWFVMLTVFGFGDNPIFFNFLNFFLLFNSHFWIDKFSLGDWWMQNIKMGKGMDYALSNPKDKFSPVVYCAVDNTLHLLLMFLIAKIVSNGGV